MILEKRLVLFPYHELGPYTLLTKDVVLEKGRATPSGLQRVLLRDLTANIVGHIASAVVQLKLGEVVAGRSIVARTKSLRAWVGKGAADGRGEAQEAKEGKRSCC